MNRLRDEITDLVVELVFCSFPSISEPELRGFVRSVLRIVDFAALESRKDEQHLRYQKNLKRSKN